MLIENSHLVTVSIIYCSLLLLPFTQLHIIPIHLPHHYETFHCFFFIFYHFPHRNLLLLHIASILFVKSLTTHFPISLSSPYTKHSNNTCFSVSSCPHTHLSSSYFHASFHWQTSSSCHLHTLISGTFFYLHIRLHAPVVELTVI